MLFAILFSISTLIILWFLVRHFTTLCMIVIPRKRIRPHFLFRSVLVPQNKLVYSPLLCPWWNWVFENCQLIIYRICTYLPLPQDPLRRLLRSNLKLCHTNVVVGQKESLVITQVKVSVRAFKSVQLLWREKLRDSYFRIFNSTSWISTPVSDGIIFIKVKWKTRSQECHPKSCASFQENKNCVGVASATVYV